MTGKSEHFKGITSACHASALADHVTSTGHNLKWDHFEILAKGPSDTHCKIKETLLIQELIINRAGGLYGRVLTEVVSTDRTQ